MGHKQDSGYSVTVMIHRQLKVVTGLGRSSEFGPLNGSDRPSSGGGAWATVVAPVTAFIMVEVGGNCQDW